MTITLAPPPVRRPAPAAPRSLPPRDPSGLDALWPSTALPANAPAQLREPYLKGRGVPFAQSKCGTCVALCCRYIAVEVDGPDVPKDFDTLRWFLLHEHTQLFIEGRKWFLMFFTRCRELSAQNTCNIHPDRPSICREYSPTWCDRDEVERRTRLTHVFRTPEELDAWRDGWVKRYEARRRKARREARQKRARRMRRDAARSAGARRSGSRSPSR
jgi:Fe-S-cluster containining protein